MSKEPKRNVYVGHRYVPKIMDEWDKTISYEGLSIVTHQGGSYTSKKRVPVGIDINDTEFWAMTGNYNAQVENYRQDVRDMEDRVTNEMGDVLDSMNDLETNTNEKVGILEQDINSNTEKIIDTNYIQDVSYDRFRDSDSNTFYYVTRIKHKDENDNIIKLQHETFPDDQKTIREFANESNSTVAFNAGYTISGSLFNGVTIKNGEVIDYKPIPSEQVNRHYILGIKEDNTLMSFPADTPISELTDNGVYNAITAFIPLINDGQSVSNEILNVFHMGEKHPRQAIGQLPNKDIIIVSTGGRGFDGDGMTAEDVVRVLFQHGAIFGHMLDGGGSTSTVVRGVLINHPIDERGRTERKHAHALYVKKEKTNLYRDQDIANINEELGNVKSMVDHKSGKYNAFGKDYDNLENNWQGTIYIRMTDDGLVNIYGSIVAGDTGTNQTVIINSFDEIYRPIVNVTDVFSEANTPWTSYNGIVVSSDGILRLVNDGNNVEEGKRIHINITYKTNY